MIQYASTEKTVADLENRFTYHKPNPEQVLRYEKLRSEFKRLATLIIENTPPGREQATALTNLETSSFWANAAIARGES